MGAMKEAAALQEEYADLVRKGKLTKKAMYEKLKEIEGIVPFERLLELAFADRAGRCVVLPCKANDTLTDGGIECRADHWNIFLTAFTLDGHKVRLLNVEEAEAALKGAQDG